MRVLLAQIPIVQIDLPTFLISIALAFGGLLYLILRGIISHRQTIKANEIKDLEFKTQNKQQQEEFQDTLRKLLVKDGEDYRTFIRDELQQSKREIDLLSQQNAKLTGKLEMLSEKHEELMEVNNILREKLTKMEGNLNEKRLENLTLSEQVSKLQTVIVEQQNKINDLQQKVILLEERNTVLEDKVKEIEKHERIE